MPYYDYARGRTVEVTVLTINVRQQIGERVVAISGDVFHADLIDQLRAIEAIRRPGAGDDDRVIASDDEHWRAGRSCLRAGR